MTATAQAVFATATAQGNITPGPTDAAAATGTAIASQVFGTATANAATQTAAPGATATAQMAATQTAQAVTPTPTSTSATPTPTSTTIAPEGGLIIAPLGAFTVTLNLPAGAVSETVTFTIGLTTTLPISQGQGYIGQPFYIIAFGANGPITTFAKPYTLTFEYTDAAALNRIEGDAQLGFWSGNGWVMVSATLAVDQNRLVAVLDHLTVFSVRATAQYRLYLPVTTRGYSSVNEVEPNNSFNQAQNITLPIYVLGAHDGATGTGDLYAITLGAGEQARVRVETKNTAGLQVLIYNSANKEIARDFEAPYDLTFMAVSSGPTYVYLFTPADINNIGTYRITLEPVTNPNQPGGTRFSAGRW